MSACAGTLVSPCIRAVTINMVHYPPQCSPPGLDCVVDSVECLFCPSVRCVCEWNESGVGMPAVRVASPVCFTLVPAGFHGTSPLGM